MTLPDPLRLGRPGEPVEMTVVVEPLPETDAERDRDCVAFLGEVRIGGSPVHGSRLVVPRSMQYSESVAQRVRAMVLAEFGVRLRTVLGYDPNEARS